MADSSPLAGLLDRAAHVLNLVGELADAIRANEHSPGDETQRRVATAWKALLPAIVEAGDSLPTDPNPVADWIREVGRVAKWFDETIRQHGLVDVLFRFNCDGFIRVAGEGQTLFREMATKRDPFAFVEAPAASNPLGIDTTPATPKPPIQFVEAAARDIPSIMANVPPRHDGAIELVASHLAKRLQDARHTLAAAQWAVHESVRAGRLKPGLIGVEFPSVGRVVGGTMRHWGGRDDRRMEWSGGGKGTVGIPKGKPAPFDSFKVIATESLWAWWHSAAVESPKQAEPAAPNDESCFDALVGQVLYWRNGVLPFYWSGTYHPGDFQRRTANPLRRCLVWLDARGFQHLSARLQTAYDAVLQCVSDLDAKYDQHPAPADATESDSIVGDRLLPCYDKTSEFTDLVEDVKHTTADVPNNGIPSKGIKAGEAFRRMMETDPETRAGWERARARLQAFAKAMQEAMESPEYKAAQEAERRRWQELADAIQANIQWAGNELTARHFTRPESIEDWEHLARIVEIPAETIRTGNLTPREIFACALAWTDRQKIKAKLAAETNTAAGQGEPAEATSDTSTPTKPKRSTERGEGRAKLIAALTKHHKYADGGCLNMEPIGNNELARLAGVSESTASGFFNKQFDGHTKYRAICADATRLVAALKLLNQEFAPHHLFGAKPPGEDEREDDE